MRNVSLSHHTSHHATSYHHFQPDSLGKFFSQRYRDYEILFLDAMNEIASVNIGTFLFANVKSTFDNANTSDPACKNCASRQHERAMQKVQMEEIVLRFLYKNVNSFNTVN